MKKTIKIKFSEQSKVIVAETSIEYEGDDVPTNDEVLVESKKLFEGASRFSGAKSVSKYGQSR